MNLTMSDGYGPVQPTPTPQATCPSDPGVFPRSDGKCPSDVTLTTTTPSPAPQVIAETGGMPIDPVSAVGLALALIVAGSALKAHRRGKR